MKVKNEDTLDEKKKMFILLQCEHFTGGTIHQGPYTDSRDTSKEDDRCQSVMEETKSGYIKATFIRSYSLFISRINKRITCIDKERSKAKEDPSFFFFLLFVVFGRE
jgi:hypothetical protein